MTPSEDSAKTEDEKKDEQEVKQEEKKEETAKADSSNKSNTSESNKNNTASTSNSSSNKNNSSSSSSKPSSKPSNSSSNNSSPSKPSNNSGSNSSNSKPSSKPSNSSNNSGSSKPSNSSGSNSNNSKPAEHTHNWVAQYKTVNVPEKGHNEQVLVQAAYDEQVPITEMREYSICSTCGADITGNTSAHMKAHMLNGENGNFHSEWRETVTGYNTVHHDAVYETRYVVDSPATTKQELTGYKCSGCGKTKAN